MERKNFAYLNQNGELKITRNFDTVLENGIGIATEIEYFGCENPKVCGGNPFIDGKEIFVYGNGTVRVGLADSKDIERKEFPKIDELYNELLELNKNTKD